MPAPFRAQTNLQLFHQLQQSGTSPEQTRIMRDAYLLALELTNGLVTGSGKPTLSHDVGAASLAHHYGASFDVVTAALLHSSYIAGDFGHLRRNRVSEEQREELRAVIGSRAESYVMAFKHLPRTSEGIARLAERTEPFSEPERGALLVMLFELLDHLLDLGAVLFFRNAGRAKAHLLERRTHLCRLAESLGTPALRDDLDHAIEMTLTSEVSPELLGLKHPGDSAQLVMPRSCRRRRSLSLVWAAEDAVRRVRASLHRVRAAR